MKRILSSRLAFFGILAALIFGFVAYMRWGSAGTSLLWSMSDGGTWLLPLIVVSALIDSINPCAISVLLITIAFLVNAGALRSRILAIGGAYVAGIFLVYLLIGLGLLQALHLFNTPHFMSKLGAWVIIIAGSINLLGYFFPAFPIRLKIPTASHDTIARLMGKGTLIAAFVLGAFVGLCEFPCTGGPYLLALGLLHDQATYWQGFGYLVLYNLIFVLPLFVLLGMASDKMLLGKVEQWKRENVRGMRLWGGIAAIALGVIILAI